MKICIVCDWLTKPDGGAMNVTLLMAKTLNADIATSIFHKENFKDIESIVKHTSFLNRLPRWLINKHEYWLHMLPLAFYTLDLKEYDIVITSDSSLTKCIKKHPHQTHICYCHSPARYLYFFSEDYINDYPLPWYLRFMKYIIPSILAILRRIDYYFAQKVDVFLANSRTTKERIMTYYNRSSEVLYPPVDTEMYTITTDKHGDYYLCVGRFVPYKRMDLLVETFVKNGLPLVLGGRGPELERCKQIVKQHNADNITFLGYVKNEDMNALYNNAKCFVFPSLEDFGIVPLEALATGLPVIYYNKGGATESMINSVSIPFEEQSVASLDSAIKHFESMDMIPKSTCRARAEQFSNNVFIDKIKSIVDKNRH